MQKTGLANYFLFLIWKTVSTWMWSLGGSQQSFSCVSGHFRLGDNQQNNRVNQVQACSLPVWECENQSFAIPEIEDSLWWGAESATQDYNWDKPQTSPPPRPATMSSSSVSKNVKFQCFNSWNFWHFCLMWDIGVLAVFTRPYHILTFAQVPRGCSLKKHNFRKTFVEAQTIILNSADDVPSSQWK